MPKKKNRDKEDEFNIVMMKFHGALVRRAIDKLVDKQEPFSVKAVVDLVEEEELHYIKNN